MKPGKGEIEENPKKENWKETPGILDQVPEGHGRSKKHWRLIEVRGPAGESEKGPP